jgi:hypothetical protein
VKPEHLTGLPTPIRPLAIVVARLIGIEIRLVFGAQPRQPKGEAEGSI